MKTEYYQIPAAFFWVLFILLAIFFVLLILQQWRITVYRRYVSDLARAYGMGKKWTFRALTEKILRSRVNYIPGPPPEVVSLVAETIGDFMRDFKVYLHITGEENIAKSILAEGFRYTEDIFQTTVELASDLSDLSYRLHLYKNYGKYTIIMCVPVKTIEEARKENPKMESDYLADYGISKNQPYGDYNYCLPANYVFGYVDMNALKVEKNPLFTRGEEK